MRKIIKHHIEGGTWESHPRVQDLLHPRLGKPRRGLQILDTRMGFPRPSLNVVLDSIILDLNPGVLTGGRYKKSLFYFNIQQLRTCNLLLEKLVLTNVQTI